MARNVYGLDLGSYDIKVYDKKKDTIWKEKNVIAFKDNRDRDIFAVGDDDQNIYEFRGSNSKYLQEFITKYGAIKYEMVRNYRSCQNIVLFANAFANTIRKRMKELNCVTDKEGGQLFRCFHSSYSG